jgi:thioredoxin
VNVSKLLAALAVLISLSATVSTLGYAGSGLSTCKELRDSFQSDATAIEPGSVQTLTGRNFDDIVVKSRKVVLVDFWAEWSGPSRRLAPTLTALAVDYAGRVKIGKVNVDESPEVANKYHIRGIPMLLLFKGGVVVESVTGVVSKDKLRGILDKHLP